MEISCKLILQTRCLFVVIYLNAYIYQAFCDKEIMLKHKCIIKKTVNSSLLHITANTEPKQNQYLLFSDFYWKITQNNNSPLFCFLRQKQCTFLEKLFIFFSSTSDPSRSQSPTQLKKTEVCFKKFQHKKFKQKNESCMSKRLI